MAKKTFKPVDTSKKIEKELFSSRFPEQFTLNQCLKRILFIKEDFKLKIQNSFKIKDYDKDLVLSIERYKLGEIREGKIILSLDTIKRLKYLLQHADFTIS